ncbi:MAG TPA: HupE/UreJ family protein [Candidatus Angelobacter sp.]|nr:HupE/UreJ family protein [Candidatus Angelobacter sp.]
MNSLLSDMKDLPVRKRARVTSARRFRALRPVDCPRRAVVAFLNLARWVGVTFLTINVSAWAHQGSSSYLNMTVDGSNVTGQWDISLIDLEQVVGLDANNDGDITPDEVRAKQSEIEDYAQSRVRVKLDGMARSLKIGELLVENFSDGAYAVLRFSIQSAGVPRDLRVDYGAFFDIDARHHGLFRLNVSGGEQTAVFSEDNPTFVMAHRSRWRQFLDFNHEGIRHISSGVDHILFLLALLLPSVLRRKPGGWSGVGRFTPALINVLKIVTAFTVAHSVTLSLATLNIVRLPPKLVETTIAASVALAAANNLRPLFVERGWLVAFCFGFVHGFGFANALTDLGLARQTLAVALVGFNLGVELGQLAIVAVFLPLAYWARNAWAYQELTLRFGSAAIALLAVAWFVERAFDLKWLPF